MAEESGPSGGQGRPEEGGRDPWAPPEQPVRMTKQPEHPGFPEQPQQQQSGGVAAGQQPTVPAMPGGGTPGPPPSAHSPVGPPPTAPGGPHPAAGYGAQGGYGAGGYGQGGYAGYGTSYPGYAGYGSSDPAWAGAPLPQGTAVASMVLGIVGLVLTVTCWGSFLGILVAPVALVLGVVARRKADRGEAGGRGYATSGFVMGLVGTVLAALMVAFLIWFLTHMEDFENDPYDPYDTGYQDARARVPAVVVPGG